MASSSASNPQMSEEQRKAEELKALMSVPQLDLPWPLMESAVSSARIKALAHMLDPSMELDDSAVKVSFFIYALV